MNLTNRMRRQVTVYMAASLAGAFLLTLLFASLISHFADNGKPAKAVPLPAVQEAAAPARLLEESTPVVPVYVTKENRIDQVPIEAYVRGVVAAEMPVEFELEALKAQALAARTYIARRLETGDVSQIPAAGKGAIVTDTVSHQAYLTREQLAAKWSGSSAEVNMAKLNRAVLETQGQIIAYEGKPINAVFFSTSNGFTENSEDYWGDAVPYLRSVPSPWDKKLSPRYKETVTMPYRSFLSKLGLNGTVTASSVVSGAKAATTTDGGRIAQIRIGGKSFSGRDVREKLGLNSSQFEWKLKGSDVEITTYGYGHGVGMSQWGANGMAKEGKTASDIVRYYYKGVSVEPYPKTSR